MVILKSNSLTLLSPKYFLPDDIANRQYAGPYYGEDDADNLTVSDYLPEEDRRNDHLNCGIGVEDRNRDAGEARRTRIVAKNERSEGEQARIHHLKEDTAVDLIESTTLQCSND